MSFKKEARDQSLHFTAGVIFTLALSNFIPLFFAALSIILIAAIRELLQHRGKKLWQLGKGSWLDLAFWLLGIGLVVGLKLAGIL